ncbi:glycerol-3-phosphate dehydrogenase, partial [Xanthomonas sp. Kuri4-1]
LLEHVRATRPWLPPQMAQRLVRNYGTRAETLLGDARALDGLGQHFGADLYQAEVDYLRTHEWARTAEDVLWRRSKLGLRIDAAGQARLADYLQARTEAAPAATERLPV